MKYERKRRVNEALRQVLARGVEELADPAIGFVTVTSVEVTRDLEHARCSSACWGATSGGSRRCARSSAPTACSRPVSRGSCTLRRTPQLTFHYDGGVDRAMRITELLDEGGEVAGKGPEGSES